MITDEEIEIEIRHALLDRRQLSAARKEMLETLRLVDTRLQLLMRETGDETVRFACMAMRERIGGAIMKADPGRPVPKHGSGP